MTIIGPTSHRFVSQRLKLHYVDWGNEGAPLLILLHGGRDHCRSWDWVAQELKNDWHVVAPDLRGHGDSDWSPDGHYSSLALAYDFAQFVHHLRETPVTIVAHSLGGNVALRYTGLYPENVKKLVAMEGLGASPKMLAERAKTSNAEHTRNWIENKRAASARAPKRYATLEEAFERMRSANEFLTEEQARHLTIHGASRNEDGTWSWKFDNYVNIWPPSDMPQADQRALWAAITCPTLLVYGAKSWASNPAEDGRAAHFQNARVELVEDAGHWIHHDQFDRFMTLIKAFI